MSSEAPAQLLTFVQDKVHTLNFILSLPKLHSLSLSLSTYLYQKDKWVQHVNLQNQRKVLFLPPFKYIASHSSSPFNFSLAFLYRGLVGRQSQETGVLGYFTD
jgi:hypothetical protein